MIKTIWTQDANLSDANQIVCRIEGKSGKFRIIVEYRQKDDKGNSWFRRYDYQTAFSFKSPESATKKAQKLEKIYSN